MDTPVVAHDRSELAGVLPEAGVRSAVVMTMGALHEGHRALMRAARAAVSPDGVVIVTIFVNPLQFGPGEDFERYPRTPDADVATCADEGVDVIFAPRRDDLYPQGEPQVTVDPGPLGRELEGAVRPGHFGGVLTVVAKLLNLTRPAYAFFGEKDYQQLTLIRRMAADLEMPAEIIGVPTVREPDGLALSSRNRYLSADERRVGVSLSRALLAGADAGPSGGAAVLAAARSVLDRHPELDVDYLELRAPNLEAVAGPGAARLLVAARIGATRLIDNLEVQLSR
ncbi:pantoate--beta-alanine ligase [Phytoactinopolyspora limicola]|uniref:pantoate--beta-alanine ligase n=1 Tax=Phytoactinopolyspora limicola TaxID=2715536 RepID=UPI001A9C932D|nr:pantoate--beta-alanine ligase [Phytoactinopolyspora limicola]